MIGGLAGGPVLQLQWFGRICPCMEKDEDRKARQALSALNQSGQFIAWYPRADDGKSSEGGTGARGLTNSFSSVGKNMVNYFKTAIRSSSSSSFDDDDTSVSTDAVNLNLSESVPAQFMIRDNPTTGVPEIFVDPKQASLEQAAEAAAAAALAAAEAARNNTKPPNKQSGNIGFKLNITLARVGSVKLHPSTGAIQLLARPPKEHRRRARSSPTRQQKNGADGIMSESSDVSAKVLLTMELRAATGEEANISVDDRDLFVHHLQVLMEWERQRRIATNDLYDPDDDDDNAAGGNFLTRRAQKASHFARREIELQQTRRQREQRKAQLIGENGAGGLKYTALAMMQRAEEK